jgi:L-threonylcarbamoyladenylate synthase
MIAARMQASYWRATGPTGEREAVITVPASAESIDVVARALRAGDAVVLPTETVYGLAVLASIPASTAKVFALKGRPADVPLAVLAESVAQVASLVDVPPLGTPVRRIMDAFWPGPLTVVLRRRADAPEVELGGDGRTIGVRCPDHDFVRTLARAVGVLAVTSANRHGEPTATTAAGAAVSLTGRVALVVDGGVCAGIPSTVLDGTDDKLTVLRDGGISRSELIEVALG